MKRKLRQIFRRILIGVRTITVFPDDDRRYFPFGGGFEQDRANLRGDVLNIAGDVRRATGRVKARMAERQGV